MRGSSYTAWGWVNHDGFVQEQTFSGPDAAIRAMTERLGEEVTMERLAELGFRLVVVNVSVRPVMVMDAVKS